METDTHPCCPWNTVFKTTLGCQPYAMLLADIMFEKDILPDVVCPTFSKEKRVPRLAAANSTTRFIPAPDKTAVTAPRDTLLPTQDGRTECNGPPENAKSNSAPVPVVALRHGAIGTAFFHFAASAICFLLPIDVPQPNECTGLHPR